MVLVRVVPSESGDEPARVDVLGSFCIKDALKAEHYRWAPERKAWWTPLEDDTLSKLKELAEREHVKVTGLDAALHASGALTQDSPASPDTRSAGGAARHTPQRALRSPYARTCMLNIDVKAGTTVASGHTFELKTALDDLGFAYTSEPTPHWTLERAADAALLSTLQDAAKESGLELRVVRAAFSPPPPAPMCKRHGVPCVLRTCGPKAMPHNRGRRYWCCPRRTAETNDECTWLWEDGTEPESDASQARFNKWMDDQLGDAAKQGECGICAVMGPLGFGGGCDYDFDYSDDQ